MRQMLHRQPAWSLGLKRKQGLQCLQFSVLAGLRMLIAGIVQKRRQKPTKRRCSLQQAPREDPALYKRLGFCVLSSALAPNVASEVLHSFESALPVWAADSDLPVETYLQVVNKWSHWNPVVATMVERIAPFLRPRVEEVLESGAWPVGATIFRKSEHAPRGTHAHQDLSYAWRPGSQLFSCTTWVALTPAAASPLQMLPGSHKHGIQAAVDFLDPDFQDRACSEEWQEAVTVQADAGDAILFDSRLWHSAAPCEGGLRVALAITWATPAGPDGPTPGQYPRWPMSALPPPVLIPRGGFGMDTVGSELKAALRFLLKTTAPITSAAQLIEGLLASPSLLARLPEPAQAEQLLRRYLDMRKAVLQHGAAGQNGRLFESLYRTVIRPARSLQALQPGPGNSSKSSVSSVSGVSGGVEEVKAWMRDWATRTPSVEAVVVFGSQARGEASRWSDLDLCVLGSAPDLLGTLARELEADCLKGHGICLTKSSEKLFALIPKPAYGMVRVDCFVVDSFRKVDNMLVPKSVLMYARKPEAVLQKLEGCQKQPCISTELHGLLTTFLEAFESASTKLLTGDDYQLYFQTFILYDCLVKLEYLLRGGRNFLYLPKNIMQQLSDELLCLEPRTQHQQAKWGLGSRSPFLLAAYLHHFQKLLSAVSMDPVLSSSLHRTLDPSQLPRSTEALRWVLQRGDPFLVQPGIYCSMAEFKQVPPKMARSVIDLHDASEVNDVNNLKASLDQETWWVACPLPGEPEASGAQALGNFLRALLVADFPVVLRCQDGRRMAAVAALLRVMTSGDPQELRSKWLEVWDVLNALGMLQLLPCQTHLTQRSEAPKVSCDGFLGAKLALGCGLSLDEFEELHRKVAGARPPDLPQVTFALEPGSPREPCRPFTAHEANLLSCHLLAKKSSKARPIGVFVTGLPAAGKSTFLAQLLSDLGVDLDECVNLDMDGVRRFHAQYQEHAQELRWSDLVRPMDAVSPVRLGTSLGLASWFPTMDAERLLYRTSDSVVSRLLEHRYSFVLPGIFDQPETLQFMKHVRAEGYELRLVGVHVPVDVATKRAERRAIACGRMSSGLSERQK